MRILFCCQPGLGHYWPLAALARLARQRGHAVAFASSPRFVRDEIGAAYPAYPVGLDWTMSELHQAFPQLRSIPAGPEARVFMAAEVFGGITARAAVGGLLRVIREWAPNVIVRDTHEFASCIVAEITRTPCASVEIGLFRDAARSWAPVASRPLNQLRAQWSLLPDPELRMLYPFLHMSFLPAGYERAQLLPASARRFQPLPEWAWTSHDLDLDGPFVYVTLGSVHNRTPGVLEALLEALASTGLTVVAAIGKNRDTRDFVHLPARVRVLPFAPQGLLIPQATVVVCHAGFNAVVSALASGKRMLLIPISADQPDHASRCLELGVARVLDRDDLDANSITETLFSLLADASAARAAQEIARATRELPNPERAIDAVEELARPRPTAHAA